MSLIIKQSIINSFNKAANTYDQYAAIQKKAAYQLYKHIESENPKIALEIGAGTGFLTELIKRRFSSSLLIVSDIADNMVSLCKNKYSDDKSLFCVADGENLPFKKNIDLTVSNLAIQWFQKFEKSLAYISSQSKVFAFSTLTNNTFYEWKQKHKELSIKYKTLDMISLKDLEIICSKYSNNKYKISTETINTHYSSAVDFIKNLKYTGAIASHSNYLPSCLKKVIKSFDKGININYDIAYCVLYN